MISNNKASNHHHHHPATITALFKEAVYNITLTLAEDLDLAFHHLETTPV